MCVYLAATLGKLKSAPVMFDAEEVTSNSIEVVLSSSDEKFLNNDGIVNDSLITGFPVGVEIYHISVSVRF